MTTHTYTSAFSHATVEAYRAWVASYMDMLDTVGLTRTTDSGQADVATIARPTSAGQVTGYEIRQFNDSLQSAAPIFIKIEYGSSTVASSVPGIFISVGTGTDGAGNLTGTISSRYGAGSTTTPGTGAYPSYACHTEGFAGVIHKRGSQTSAGYVAAGSWIVNRTCDANGYPTADGAIVYYGDSSPVGRSLRFRSPAAVINTSVSSNLAHLPLNVAGTVSGEIPLYPMWMPLPEVLPVFGVIAYPASLISSEDVTEVAMVGSQNRKYLLTGPGIHGSTSLYGLGILWE